MLKREESRRWLTERLHRQKQLIMGSLAGMIVLGLVATLLEFTVFLLIIKVGFISNGVLASMATLAILAAIQLITWLRLPARLPDIEHEGELEDSVTTIKVAPNMTAVWTYALGSIESDRTWVEMLLGVLALPQRLCSAAWFTWQRHQELSAVAIEPCAAVIRLLHKEAERVELKVIAAEINSDDLTGIIRQVSLIDGVVFLTRKSIGLSLANRLVDDIDEWKQKRMAEKEKQA
jgi:hypothetical protein